MTLHLWLAFLVAAAILLVIPGPTIIAVVSHSLAHGRKAVIPLVAGVTLGDFTAMTVSLLGLGTLLAASATLFSALKLVGAGYLVYLGVRLWRLEPQAESFGAATESLSNRTLVGRLFLTTTLNPKSIAFFIAFLPQFVNPGAPVRPQLLLLGGTFLFMAAVNAALYGLFAGQLREKMQRRRVRCWFNRCGGTALIGAGLFTAALQRP